MQSPSTHWSGWRVQAGQRVLGSCVLPGSTASTDPTGTKLGARLQSQRTRLYSCSILLPAAASRRLLLLTRQHCPNSRGTFFAETQNGLLECSTMFVDSSQP
uniref:Secreted protein n=1 Tax=Macrostomum lignano TaxID=282301 RepID=A0A1I8JQZ9_9PLAT